MTGRKTLSVINVLGELLITVGVLVLLFLGWQLWINDSMTAASAQRAAAVDATKWTPPSGTTAEPEKDYGAAPVAPSVGTGQTIAVIYIPRLGLDSARSVKESVTPTITLNRGFYGHYPDSALPGEAGNFALAVHRGGWGSNFKEAQILRTGDHIYLETKQGYYSYTVRNIEYVLPSSVDVLNEIPGSTRGAVAGQSILTITTCSPQNDNTERIAVYAVYDSWRPLSAGPFSEIIPMKKKS
jgi:sortase A